MDRLPPHLAPGESFSESLVGSWPCLGEIVDSAAAAAVLVVAAAAGMIETPSASRIDLAARDHLVQKQSSAVGSAAALAVGLVIDSAADSAPVAWIDLAVVVPSMAEGVVDSADSAAAMEACPVVVEAPVRQRLPPALDQTVEDLPGAEG